VAFAITIPFCQSVHTQLARFHAFGILYLVVLQELVMARSSLEVRKVRWAVIQAGLHTPDVS